ncbi:hypothetical protein FGK60_28865 [Streptomyces sp. DASNCL29]|nr:hypothetical protein FGK60_28865 [Streptomyces sp. DASNCL29]
MKRVTVSCSTASGQTTAPRRGRIEHHLFPSMPRTALPAAQPLIRAYCAELALPYAQTGLVDSYRQALRHLHAVGAPLRAERRA